MNWLFGFVGGFIVGFIVTIKLLAETGAYVPQRQCDKLGAFLINGQVYECWKSTGEHHE